VYHRPVALPDADDVRAVSTGRPTRTDRRPGGAPGAPPGPREPCGEPDGHALSAPPRTEHATFTNEELREESHTIEALRDADRLSGHLSWIRSTDKLDIRVRTSDHVRERR